MSINFHTFSVFTKKFFNILFKLHKNIFSVYNRGMKIVLKGEAGKYKYAVEQMLLTVFPDERPEYVLKRPQEDCLSVSLSRAEMYSVSVCMLKRDGKVFKGMARELSSALTDEITTDRICQRLIKNSIYRAALSSGIKKPVWGSLTGVRPGKIFRNLLRSGLSPDEAARRFETDYGVDPVRAKLCSETSLETLKAEESLAPKDICLYVGIPFCPTRCSYCSFVSASVEKSTHLIVPFLDALEKEAEALAAETEKCSLRVVSLYFGGGTPTTLSASQFDRLFSLLESLYDLSSLRENTVEAGRPDTITSEKLEVLKKHGVTRISVNPQTMNDSVLEAIGRKHTASDILNALSLVREAGDFDVNMDLIAGLPRDDPESFRRTLDQVISLSPENVTVHTLSLKKGSAITLGKTALPSAEEVSQMLDDADVSLRKTGYSPYYLYRQKFMSGGFENTGWAKPGHVNLYNICIMEELCSILALGGGGSSKLIAPGDGRNIRLMAPKYPLEYIEHSDKLCEDKKKIAEFLK